MSWNYYNEPELRDIGVSNTTETAIANLMVDKVTLAYCTSRYCCHYVDDNGRNKTKSKVLKSNKKDTCPDCGHSLMFETTQKE